MTGEPPNDRRAQRIDALLIAYNKIVDNYSDGSNADHLDLACILADMRHWCDERGADFYAALDLSYRHYLEERADATPA